ISDGNQTNRRAKVINFKSVPDWINSTGFSIGNPPTFDEIPRYASEGKIYDYECTWVAMG
ncbi:hypothetical protein CF069_20740, partial [Clostridium botulinum]